MAVEPEVGAERGQDVGEAWLVARVGEQTGEGAREAADVEAGDGLVGLADVGSGPVEVGVGLVVVDLAGILARACDGSARCASRSSRGSELSSQSRLR